MSWRPTYRGSKFRNVYGKVANREHCFDGIPITKNVHDNHFCAVNSKFVAVVTESSGGGSFIVIPVSQVTGAVTLLICSLLLCQVVWKNLFGGCISALLDTSVSEEICECFESILTLAQHSNFALSLVNNRSSGDSRRVKAFRMLKRTELYIV